MLVKGASGSNPKSVVFEYMSRNIFLKICCEIALRWTPQNTFDDKLMLSHNKLIKETMLMKK